MIRRRVLLLRVAQFRRHLLADNETLWKILPIESQNSAAGDWGTLGKTIETFLLGVELADFFSFSLEAKLLEEVLKDKNQELIFGNTESSWAN